MNSLTSPITSARQIPVTDEKIQPLQSWARGMVLRLLIHLQHGQLTIRERNRCMTFGHGTRLHAAIEIHDPRFYLRVLTGGSIAAGESYTEGLWDTDDLTAVIRLIAANQDILNALEKKLAWLSAPLNRLKHLFNNNSRRGSKKNILAHYDLGNEMYKSFLDPTMMYSSAIYPEPEASLEEASVHKLDQIRRRLQLNPQDRVIEIGSGWGGFAIHAAQNYGCHVTTTTISNAQFKEAQKRIAELGLSNRITLLQEDYRDLKGRYDKLVSIEMIEAVGYRHLPVFMAKCSQLLNENGLMLIQAITLKDELYQSYLNSVDFIQRHIFPGGCLLSERHMKSLINDQSDLQVDEIRHFGLDYARTLKDWRERFNSNFERIRPLGYDDRFRRLWEFYFCYCEGGFRERTIDVIHLVACKDCCQD